MRRVRTWVSVAEDKNTVHGQLEERAEDFWGQPLQQVKVLDHKAWLKEHELDGINHSPYGEQQ